MHKDKTKWTQIKNIIRSELALRRRKHILERIPGTRKQLKIWEILLRANVKKIMVTELFFRETYLEYE